MGAVSWVNAQPASTVQPGGSPSVQGVEPPGVVGLPPELYPPAQSTGVFLSASAPIVGAGTVVVFPGMQFAPPAGMVGVMDSLTILIDGIVITTNIVFSLAVNGALVPGFQNLTILPRNGATFASVGLGPFLRIGIPLGGQMTAQVVDVDGGTYNVGMQARGWYWPAQR